MTARSAALDLLSWEPKGATYSAELDRERLSRQQEKVWAVMKRGAWMTLAEIANWICEPEASISARLRDLRRLGFTVDKRRRPNIDPKRGVWEYHVSK